MTIKAEERLPLFTKPFQLGDYEVDPKTLRIEQPGHTVRVEFKVMQVLLVLANQAGEVVSRRTLESTVWAGRIVTEDAVTNAVAKLRRAFGDHARAPTYIETVPKQGYRLMLKPERLARKGVSHPPFNPRLRISLAGALAAALIIATLLLRLIENESVSPEDPIGVAVESTLMPGVTLGNGSDDPGRSDFANQLGATNTLAAYDEFLLGLAAYRRLTPDDVESARAHYLRAIELDPHFGRAYAGLALTWMREVMDGWTTDSDQAIQVASQYVTIAEATDPDVPQIYFVKGLIALFQGQHLAAAQAAQNATQLDPYYADAYGLLAWVLQLGGRSDVATEALQEALRLKPQSSASYEAIAGEISFSSGRYAEAEARFRNALDRNPNHLRARIWLVASLAQTEKLDDARWELDEVLAQSPGISFENAEFGLPQKDPEVLSRFFRAVGIVRRLD